MVQQPQVKPTPTMITQTVSVNNPAQPAAVKTFIKVTVLFLTVILPLVFGMGFFVSNEMRTIQQHLIFLSHVKAVSVNLFKFPPSHLKALVPFQHHNLVSSVWDAQQMQSLATSVSSHMNAINNLIMTFEARATYADLLTYPFGPDNGTISAPMHGVTIVFDIASIPAQLRPFQSSQGWPTFANASDSSSSTTIAIPTALGQVPASIQTALAHAATAPLKQINLGMELLFRLNMMAAVTDSNHVAKEVTMIHGIVIGILVVVFWLLWVLQARMREEIKQNCVLLLMIPPSFLRSQKPIMHYLREICSKLRKYYPIVSKSTLSSQPPSTGGNARAGQQRAGLVTSASLMGTRWKP
ncbi:hypothetical protein BCR44DRAFT_1425307 [Catenaria anguillulae PL171]|uniref:Uncharacterized protein n=1 Tax=Catenaria anguillulae PL171 TaxID=765915 RepID=A0A1Y2I135_9FUNG|nr:hypothetical protein BCR44DRAFT_1425307 [Catenaria anguillulae PL171]